MALQLPGENTNVATKNEVSISKEQNVAQRLSSEHKSPPIGCTENTENKGKSFSCRNVGNSFYILIMMMEDSTTFQEEQIQNRIMGRLENNLLLINLHRNQSTLIRNC